MLGPFDQPKTPEVKKVLNDKKVSDHHAIIPTVELAEFDFSIAILLISANSRCVEPPFAIVRTYCF